MADLVRRRRERLWKTFDFCGAGGACPPRRGGSGAPSLARNAHPHRPRPRPCSACRLPPLAQSGGGCALSPSFVPLRPSPCPAPRPPRKSGIFPSWRVRPSPCPAPLDTIRNYCNICCRKCRNSVILGQRVDIRRRPSPPSPAAAGWCVSTPTLHRKLQPRQRRQPRLRAHCISVVAYHPQRALRRRLPLLPRLHTLAPPRRLRAASDRTFVLFFAQM